MNIIRWMVLSGFLLLMGCASWNSENGVDNAWRSESVPEWVVGQTTDSDVTAELGPPSQIIGLEDQTVFYYLREHRQGQGLVLLLYNRGSSKAVYDRAIFFFDKQGVLTKHAYSREALPYEDADR